jgi:hypothetical protein
MGCMHHCTLMIVILVCAPLFKLENAGAWSSRTMIAGVGKYRGHAFKVQRKENEQASVTLKAEMGC